MRPRLVPSLVWLVATVLATAVAFTATHTVGDVVRGTGPIGAEYRPAAQPEPGPASTTGTRVLDYPAGRLTVRCAGRAATLVAKRPRPGWRVADFERGPDEDVDVTFARRHTEIRIEVYCNEGAPSPVVSEAWPQHR